MTIIEKSRQKSAKKTEILMKKQEKPSKNDLFRIQKVPCTYTTTLHAAGKLICEHGRHLWALGAYIKYFLGSKTW